MILNVPFQFWAHYQTIFVIPKILISHIRRVLTRIQSCSVFSCARRWTILWWRPWPWPRSFFRGRCSPTVWHSCLLRLSRWRWRRARICPRWLWKSPDVQTRTFRHRIRPSWPQELPKWRRQQNWFLFQKKYIKVCFLVSPVMYQSPAVVF